MSFRLKLFILRYVFIHFINFQKFLKTFVFQLLNLWFDYILNCCLKY